MRAHVLDSIAYPTFLSKVDTAQNTAAALTQAADAAQYWAVQWVYWSYSAAPTGGKLTIAIGGTTVFEQDITDAGPGFVDFGDYPLYVGARTLNQACVITLAAGGGTTVAKVMARVI